MGEPTDKLAFDSRCSRDRRKWAVLAAMTANMARKGIEVPSGVFDAVRNVRTKIASGCFSPCEVGCDLAEGGRAAFLARLSSGTASV